MVDPLQYSCQQNYTILSTDGFWNQGAGYMLDGSTRVGDQDGAWPAPYNDGAAVPQQRTSRLQSSTETQWAERGTLQSRATQLQSRTQQLQSRTVGATNTGNSNRVTRTSSDWGSTWTNWGSMAAVARLTTPGKPKAVRMASRGRLDQRIQLRPWCHFRVPVFRNLVGLGQRVELYREPARQYWYGSRAGMGKRD